MKNKVYSLSFVAMVSLLAWLGAAQVAVAQDGQVAVLRMSPAISGPYSAFEENGTIWRYFETWQTDVAKKEDGKLIRLDPVDPYQSFDPAKVWADDQKNRGGTGKTMDIPLKEATQIKGSAFPPADWVKPEFDDTTWFRTITPMRMNYRSLAMVCVRGKFNVTDPAKVSELNLDLSVQGGAVVYLNGKEVGRVGLPQGKIENDTLADDYPEEAFFASNGCPMKLSEPGANQGKALPPSEKGFAARSKDADLTERYKKRFRHTSLKIASAGLHKGVNVLAVEVHRAPAAAGMFTRLFPKETGYDLTDRYNCCWNRAGVEELDLTAKAAAGAIVPNTARPAGVQAWNWPITEDVDVFLYGDPNEPVSPIKMMGAKNGAFAGQVVVSSPKPIKGLKADVTDLKGAGGVIPKAALQIRYPRFLDKGGSIGFSAMEDAAPADVPIINYRLTPDRNAAIQPVWLTVQVPKDAKGGDYTGTLTVSAEGMATAAIPVQFSVSDYALPNPQEFQTYNALIQSPDTLAMRYNVQMWSEEHWKLIDKSFQLMGMVAAKDLTIPLLAKTHFGNENGMVTFEKQADGKYKPNFDILEKYIDTAVKHLGKIPTVSFYIIERDESGCPPISELDPATKTLKQAKAPAWGTPESLAFWKPVFDGCRKILAKHGMEKSISLGYHENGDDGPTASPACLKDCVAMVPEARWVRLGHMFTCRPMDPALSKTLDKGVGGNPWARVALVIGGTASVHWDPDTDRPFYGWLNPYPVIGYPREMTIELRDWRMAAEKIMFAGMTKAQASWGMCDIAGMFDRTKFLGTKGLGPMGADFFAVLASGRGAGQPLCGRYADPSRLWYTVGLTASITQLLGEGEKGPVSNPRVENFRESLQDCEAHIFCQNALLDAKLKAKLPADLAAKCKKICDDHVRMLRYRSEFSSYGTAKTSSATHVVFNPSETQEYSRKLYELAAEVSKAIGPAK